MALPKLDREMAIEALRAWRDAGGNKTQAARDLGIAKSTFERRLRACTRDQVELDDGTFSPLPYVTQTVRREPGWWRGGSGAHRTSDAQPTTASDELDPLGLLRPEGEASRAELADPPPRVSAPKGWEPGVVWKGGEGTLCVAVESPPSPGDWDELLAVWDLDPARYCVVGEPEFRAWDTAAKGPDDQIVTKRLFYYKARIGLRAAFVPPETIEVLLSEIAQGSITPPESGSDCELIVCLADWQLGKGDGDGVRGTVQRALRGIEGIPDTVAELRRLGRAPGRIHVQGMGDIVEQCDGHYPSQSFTTQLNRRDQVKLARRLIVRAVEVAADLAPRITVSAVPGNHGENRKGGKRFTGDADNDDVAVFEQVADIASRAASLDHVAFVLPTDELQVVLEIGGARVGFHHGHVGQSGATPQAKQRRWWGDMVFSRTSLEHVDILVTAHYHHLSIVDYGPRVHVQCPTIDGGSKWWEDKGGGHSRAGTLAFTVRDVVPGDWRVL